MAGPRIAQQQVGHAQPLQDQRQVAQQRPGLRRHHVVPLVLRRQHEQETHDGRADEQRTEPAVRLLVAFMPDRQHEHVENGHRHRGGQRAEADQPDGLSKQGDGALQPARRVGPDAEAHVPGVAQRQQEERPAHQAGHLAIRRRHLLALQRHGDHQPPDDDQVDDVEPDLDPHAHGF